ncbi:SDR family NAD(P)-dependent oxidoreductase [Ruminiclostridium cellulolyticum]|uniref:Beta-ketoacyl synthase n=1 Tax=Ruminiclostridium cellulolyticum (strain ATCC 35319 / DSM 5812 / JCM 6584 / H10) TaxID=394503 RepID=B8I8K1_RUMCH|nr:SDR family NAD(P)-dependent oxidoreductase [Ruminiclostridium cellulolyticum]ACL75234.1 Beta-ketoacyl synthase [Ruminiclostridium cellulolyticum H10]
MSNRYEKLRDTLERIKKGQITSEEGFKFIKELNQTELESMYYENSWEESPLLSQDKKLGNLLVFDTDESSSKMFKKFLKPGCKAVTVKPGKSFGIVGKGVYEINPNEPEDYKKLVDSLNKNNAMPNEIIHLWSKGEFPGDTEELKLQIESGVYSIFYLTKELMGRNIKDRVRLIYIYTSQKEALQPQYAAVSGFMKTVRLENSKFLYTSVELDEAFNKDAVESIVSEFYDENETMVRYEGGRRLVKRVKELTLGTESDTAIKVKEKGVYIITGGSGGLGLIFAEHLAKSAKARLVLVGRSELSVRKADKIEKMKALGAEVIYVKADVANKNDARELVDKAMASFGKIDGIIHSAGIINDSFIMKKTSEDMQGVLSAKVYGTFNMNEATKGIQLDFFVVFSSIASVLGNAGQCDYSYGNAFMDSFAVLRERLRQKGLVSGKTLSINWPLWEEGGMRIPDEERKQMAKHTGLNTLPTEEGLKVWKTLKLLGKAQAAVFYGNREKALRFIEKRICGKKTDEMVTPETSKEKAGEEVSVDPVILREKTEGYLKEVFGELLKIPIDKIDAGIGFQEYGIDSIVVNQFNAIMEASLGALSKTLLYEYQTIAELTDYLTANFKGNLVSLLGLDEKKAVPIFKKETAKNLDIGYVQELKPLRGKSVQKGHWEANREAEENEQEIAIIGVSGRYPDAENLNVFWENLKNGRDSVSEVPKDRWDIDKYFDPDPEKSVEGKMYSKWGGFLKDADKFDPLFFSISPKEAELIDPQERLFLQAAWAVLEDAGYTRKQIRELTQKEKGANVGVFAGVTGTTYQLLGPEEWSKGNYVVPNSMQWSVANRVSYAFNFRGPSMPVDTACSSALTAIHLACNSLKKGECELAIAGGVNIYMHPSKYVSLSQARMLSPKGKCHAFGADGDGFVPGEGVGAILLKPLQKAIADKDYIYGVIKGSALNHGGTANGYTVPNPNAQAGVINDALKGAKVDARTISYIEAHGTGTSLGDPIEITGLTKAFREYTNDKSFCSIGSVKSNIGHLESGAGIVAITKVLLQMKYKKLVPSLYSKQLNPKINFEDSPFYVQQELQDWKRPEVVENGVKKTYPRRAGISSFGAGGSNAHMLLEEYDNSSHRRNSDYVGSCAIVLSAKNRERLIEYAGKMVEYLKKYARELNPNSDSEMTEDIRLLDLAYTLQIGREAMDERIAFTAKDLAEVVSVLEGYSQGETGFKNFYSGNIKRNKTDNKAGAAVGGDLGDICRLWVSGTEIEKELLYKDTVPNRIPLPSYPFAKDTYMVPEAPEDNKKFGTTAKLHPLIDSNQSTLQEQCFIKSLTKNDFVLRDHIVSDNMILPGVAYLEMAYAAGALANGVQKVKTLRNIIWAKPIVYQAPSTDVRVSLYPDNGNVEYEVTTLAEDGIRIVHSQGRIDYKDDSENRDEFIDIEDIKKRCSLLATGEQCYDKFSEAGFRYGPGFKAIGEILGNKDEALSTLVVPNELKKGFEDYVLHPTIMDGALQTAAGLINSGEGKQYLPFALGEVEIISPLFEKCYAYVTISDNTQGAGANLRKFDIMLTDEKGRVLIKIKDFLLRELETDLTKKAYGRIYYVNEWEKSPAVAKTVELKENVLVLDGNDEVCEIIREHAVNQAKVIQVKQGPGYKELGENLYEINPEAREDYSSLIKSLEEKNMLPDKIIHLWSKADFDTNTDALKSGLQRGIYSIFYITGEMLKRKLKDGMTLLYMFDSAKGEQPVNSAVSGFAKTLEKENPKFIIKTVEMKNVESMDVLTADIALNELNDDQYPHQVLYKEGERFVKQLKEYALKEEKQSDSFKQQGVYIITGGAGGLGLIYADYLAKNYKAHIVLTGRSELTSGKKEKLKEIEAYASSLIYKRADISDPKAVAGLVAEVKFKHKAINGVIHAAGVLRDSFILNKTSEEFDGVIGPKVFGTVGLYEALKQEKLDFFAMFSSTAGVTGNAGQGDYAFANSFMDAFSHKLNLEGGNMKTISFNWPLWKDGGMQVDKKSIKMMEKMTGIAPLSIDAGVKAFECGLGAGVSQFMVLEGNIEKIKKTMAPKQEDDTSSCEITVLDKEEEARLRQKTEDFLKNILSKEIKLPPAKIDPYEPMESYGIDSVMIMGLTRELENQFGELSKTLFFEYQSIHELAGYFIQNHQSKLVEKIGEDKKPQPAQKEKAKPVENIHAQVRSRFDAQVGVSGKAKGINEDVAVIGISGRYPMSKNVEEFWENLKNARDCIEEIPSDRWDYTKDFDPDKNKRGKSYTKWGGFIDDVDKFDPLFFNMSPMEAQFIDPQERIYLETVWQAIEDSGYTKSKLTNSGVGVFVGVMYGHYQLFGVEECQKGNMIALESSYASVANRISYFFNFHGPSIALDTMCSSSITAIHLACESLKRGESEIAIAGGVNVTIHPNKYILLSQGKFAASDGRCKSFGKDGDGYVAGEGSGALVLKPLSKAVADGDHIYGVIKGTAINHGGKTNSYTVPSPNAQSWVILEALRNAGINPRTISYIEAHGTGTSLGDPIEITGLMKAFGEYTKDKEFCSIGSAKSNIGHLEAAAGVAAVTKVLLQMKYKKLVPSIHSETLNPNINFKESCFVVQHKYEDWKQPVIIENGVEKTYPRRAGVSSFGAGGANAHIIIEEYTGNSAEQYNLDEGVQVIILSARNEDRLKAYAKELVHYLKKYTALSGEEDKQKVSLSQIAYTLQTGREPMDERLALGVSSLEEMLEKLEMFVQNKNNIDGLYRGNVKKSKDKSDLLIEGEEGEEFLRRTISKRKMEKLAKLWTAGIDIDWSLLYKKHSVISLPSYPFARERYWVPKLDGAENGQEYGQLGMARLHPMIDSNVSTFEEQCFMKTLTEGDFYIKDHVIGQDMMLPGVAYIEMARAAGTLASRRESVRVIKNIVWAKPVTLTDGSKEVYISLYPKNEYIDYEVFSIPDDGRRVIHSQGRLAYGDHELSQPEVIDIEGIKKACTMMVKGKDCYTEFEASGFNYGESFKTLQDLYLDDNGALALIKLPEGLENTFDRFVLHPSIIDSALQASAILIGKTLNDAVYLPYSIGEIKILGPIPAKCYAYVKTSDTGKGGVKGFNIKITDEAGQVAVAIRDFTVKEYRGISQDAGGDTVYYTCTWEKVQPLKQYSEDYGNIMIFDTDEGLTQALKQNSRGSIVLVKPGDAYSDNGNGVYTLNPADGEHYARLVGDLKAKGINPVNILHLWSKQGFETSKEGLDAQLDMSVYSVFRLTKALMAQKIKDNINLLYVYNTREKAEQPLYSAVSGFIRTTVKESSNLRYKLVEIRNMVGSAISNLDTFINELKSEDSEYEILYNRGERYVKRTKEYENKGVADILPIKEKGTYLITGGMGGLGLIFAEHLSKKYKANLVLTGRLALEGERKTKLAELEALGANILYIQADICDQDQVQSLAVKAKSAFSKIDGVIHGAGVLRDSLIINKSQEDMDAVVAPKVFGTVLLDEALKSEKLDFFAVFSSTTGVLGNVGQCDYAFGNGFMDNYVELRQRQNPGTKYLSINWPLWKNGGMKVNEQAVTLMKKMAGIAPLSTGAGIKAFEKGLASDVHQIMVLQGDTVKIKAAMSAVKEKTTEIAKEPIDISPEENSQIRQKTETYLKELLSKLIGLNVSRIDSNEAMEVYGIDSVMIMDFTRELEEKFGELSKTLFFEYQTIAGLTGYFTSSHMSTLVKMFGQANVPQSAVKPTTAIAEPIMKEELQSFRSNRFMNMGGAYSDNGYLYEDIAIIGVSGRYPMAQNIEELWENLKHGKDCVVEIPSDRWDYRPYYDPDRNKMGKANSKWGGFIDNVDKFDPMFFNISPIEAQISDPQERLFLQTVWHAVEDAGYTRQKLSNTGVGVFVGVMYGQYQLYGVEESMKGNDMALQSTFASIANRVSYYFNFRGPSIALDTMCSSSLTAIHLACDSIRKGEIEMAVAGGVNLTLHPNKYILLSQGKFMSTEGKCRAFGEGGDGYVPGEGVGAVILKPLSKAVADRDNIYAVIKASELNHGGKTNGYTVPNPNAQANVISNALRKGKINPATISYIEAHGTGTSLGDPIEIAGLSKAFRQYTSENGFCSIGSIKANIGHLESASGIVGITKILLQMKYKMLVPSILSETLNSNINFEDSPFYVQHELEPWERPVIIENGVEKTYPRRAGISSFGAGGANAHIILEEYAADFSKQAVSPLKKPNLIVLSAKNEERLKEYAEELYKFLQKGIVINLKEAVNKTAIIKQLQTELLEIATGIINVPAEQIDMSESIHEYGFEPVSLTEFADSINEKYDISTDFSLFNEYISIANIAEYLFKTYEDVFAKPDTTSLIPAQDVSVQETISLTDMAYTLQTGREAMEERLAIVVEDLQELREKLMLYCQDKNDIDGLYKGNIKSGKAKSELIIDGDEGEEFIRKTIHNKKLDRIARLWVSAVEIDWSLLYDKEMPNRISLPVYPFAKQSYWVPGTDDTGDLAGRRGVVSRLHPLIDTNESTLQEQCFKKLLTGSEFYLRDHSVGGEMLLPGAVYIEMARVAGNLANKEGSVVSIRDITWIRPIAVGTTPKEAYISLYPVKDGIEYEVSTRGEGGIRLVHAGGMLSYGDLGEIQSERIELEEIKARCNLSMNGEECYKVFKDKGFNYGPGFKTIKKLVANKTEALAYLELPTEAGGDLESFMLHPSLTDGALQAVAGLVGDSSIMYLPYAIGEVKLIGALTEKCYSYVSSAPKGSSENLKFNIKLTDEDGCLLAEIKEFIVKPYKEAMHSKPEIAAEEKTSTMVVKEVSENIEGEYENSALIKRTEEYLKNVLSKVALIPVNSIDSAEPLDKYGIDSIMIMNLTGELQSHFGELSKTLFFEYQSISELAGYFIENHLEKLLERVGDIKKPGTLNIKKARQEVQKNGTTQKVPETSRSRFAYSSSATMQEDIAIIGLSGRYPMAKNVEEFWENLKAARDSITEIPKDRWDFRKYYDADKNKRGKAHSKWGGFIEDADKFDPLFFNMSPIEAQVIDPQERIFLETVWQTIEDAGYTRQRLDNAGVGLYVGVMSGQYQMFGPEENMRGNMIALGSSYASIANRVSYFFDFHGPSMAIDTMCSSSLTCIHLACDSLRKGEIDIAIAGGVNLSLHPNKYLLLSQGKFMSTDGRCRAFGSGGDGYVPGEGVGAVVLKPLSKAEQDGDQIYGVIKATALNHGGKTNGYTVPNPNYQAKVISEALKKAGIDPRTISYVEAHGTGTSLGDPIEITGLMKAYGEYTKERQFCSIGSAKSNIGHLESAAGIAGLTKVLLQMKHKQLVPSLHSEILNPNINFKDSPFYVQHTLSEWKQPIINENGMEKKYPRRAGLSSFGAGGSNAHIIIEEYQIPKESGGTKDEYIMVLSSKNEERLKAYAKELSDYVKKHILTVDNENADILLADMAYTLAIGREPMEERLAIVVPSLHALNEKLSAYVQGKNDIDGVYTGSLCSEKSKSEFFLDGKEGEEFLKIITMDRKLNKLAQLWTSGAGIDWSLLFDDENRAIISLPAYPFARERCWIPGTEEHGHSGGTYGRIAKIHPLLDKNTSTLREQRFTTVLNGKEFFLENHTVGGKKVLPGAVYIEMARAAGTYAGEQEAVAVSGIAWAKPIVVDETPKEVNIGLYPDEDKVDFEVYTIGDNGVRLVHSEGSISFEPSSDDSVTSIDLDAIKKRCTNSISGEDLYKGFERSGFGYGQSFRAIKELQGNASEVLSSLELPDSEGGDDGFVLQISLIDGAFQTVAGLVGMTGDSFLPYETGEIEIIGKLTPKCFAYVLKAESFDENPETIKFNIMIVDETGKISVRIKDFTVKKLNKEAAIRPVKIVGRAISREDIMGLEGSAPDKVMNILKSIEERKINADEADRLMEEIYESSK